MASSETTNTVTAGSLTVPNAAKRLGVPRSSLYAAILADEVPVIRLAGGLRVPTAWVEKVLIEGYDPHKEERQTRQQAKADSKSGNVTPLRGRRKA